VDVELPRARWTALRDSLQLKTGSRAWLKPQRVTRFVAGQQVQQEADDPAAAI